MVVDPFIVILTNMSKSSLSELTSSLVLVLAETPGVSLAVEDAVPRTLHVYSIFLFEFPVAKTATTVCSTVWVPTHD